MNELNRAMNPTTEEAIKYMEGMVFPQDFSPSTLRAVAINKMCVAALRKEAERDKPLTLEELQNMGGEPVWILEWDTITQTHSGHWELSEDAEDYLCDREECFYGMTKHDSKNLHPKGWLAYRSKPLEEHRRSVSHYDTVQISNGDYIRSMSDADLAELFHGILDDGRACTLICNNLDRCKRNNAPVPVCKNHYLDWLKEPHAIKPTNGEAT